VPRALLLALVMVTACRHIAPTRPRSAITFPASTWPSDTQVHWYDVEGENETELRASLDTRGPQDTDGVRHDAYTSWQVTWRFPFAQSEEGCSTGPVSTSVRVTITVPRWAGPIDDAPLTGKWRRYLEALETHESGHRETGFRAATDITEELAALPPKPTCEEAELIANAAAATVLERYRGVDTEYDAETRHGVTQGAVFP
jgi:predicted secreted Zn-dependent protease